MVTVSLRSQQSGSSHSNNCAKRQQLKRSNIKQDSSIPYPVDTLLLPTLDYFCCFFLILPFLIVLTLLILLLSLGGEWTSDSSQRVTTNKQQATFDIGSSFVFVYCNTEQQQEDIISTRGLSCKVFCCFDRELFTFLSIHGDISSKTLV